MKKTWVLGIISLLAVAGVMTAVWVRRPKTPWPASGTQKPGPSGPLAAQDRPITFNRDDPQVLPGGTRLVMHYTYDNSLPGPDRQHLRRTGFAPPGRYRA